MSNIPDNTPILIGVGQTVSHWCAEDPITDAPSPISMAAIAAKRAIDDAAAAKSLAKSIDTLALVRTMADSIPSMQYPLGAPKNAPGALAYQLNIQPELLIYADVGGDTPQSLVSEMAERIHNGTTKTALIAGGEATSAMRVAGRANITLDWSMKSIGQFEDRGFGPALLSDYEMRHGLALPTQVYALFEEAWRHKNGLTRSQHKAKMAELFAPFSKISADNPYAQFGEVRSVDFLQTRSQENYDISSPYLKWHVAQDAVNQGAAVLMTSVGEAKKLGVSENKWIYLHSNAEVRDSFITERQNLSSSHAMKLVLDKVLSDSGLSIGEIAYMDLYSCFPCAVFFAAEALGINWQGRQLAVTGGLPFFGAPGNNYSLHAIATLAELLRNDRSQYGLILANGGYLSKESAGIYSAKPKYDWVPTSSEGLQTTIDSNPKPPIDNFPENGEVVAHTISYYRGNPLSGFAMCETEKGHCLAKIMPKDSEQLIHFANTENFGAVTISTKNNVNYLSLPY